jgi:hypothetical protein
VASTADDIRPEYFVLNSDPNRKEILDSLLNHSRFRAAQSANEDTIRLKKTVASFLLKICQLLELEDTALKCEPILSGSTSENTKIGLPDEFDYMLLVENLGTPCETIESC